MKQILRRVKTHTKSKTKRFFSRSLFLSGHTSKDFLYVYGVQARATRGKHSRQWSDNRASIRRRRFHPFVSVIFVPFFLWKLSLCTRTRSFFPFIIRHPGAQQTKKEVSLSLSLEKRKVELKKWAFRFFVSRRQNITTSPNHHHNYHHRCHDSFQFLVFDVAIVVACIKDGFC